MNIKAIYRVFEENKNIVINSQNARRKSIFFALKGTKQNGDPFALEAIEKGCACAVVSDPKLKTNPKCFVVPDPLKALQHLALYHRLRSTAIVIAITGTNGKTTTKELTAKVLNTTYKTLATEGNYNNHIGVPLTLLKMRAHHQIAIIEMGASQRHDIAFLCGLAHPDFGLITNYGKAHLKSFRSKKKIIKTKSELYHFLEQNRGTAIVNQDDEKQLKNSTSLSKKYHYGEHATDFKITPHTSNSGLGFVRFSNLEITSKLLGIYNAENMAAAAAIGKCMRVTDHDIATALRSYIPKNRRTEILKTNGNLWIIDTYNANPDSMKLSIEMLRSKRTKLKKILILGDMMELGVHEVAEHRQIIQTVIQTPEFEKIIFVGKVFKHACKNTSHRIEIFEEPAQLKRELKNIVTTGNIILIKGSRSMDMEQIISN